MIEIYTDGAYSSLRNQGGWAFIITEDNEILEKRFGSVLKTTNNRMEIMAVLEALKLSELLKLLEVTIYTDSMYVIGTLTKNWKRKKNLDLWEQIDQTIKNIKVHFKHVKGHSGNKFNEQCDTLAVHGSQIKIIE